MTQQGINNASMLKVGTILRGTYRIDSYLSSGGFGNTYIATNIEFDERVAIKEFFMKGVTQRDDNQTTVSVSNTENHSSFLQQKEKFKKEARRIRQLNNNHIIRVHDLFEENGTAYYVMDFVDGENLAERLKHTGKPMTEEEVLDILPQILNALESVHNAGIWHLDLKPANIMVDKSGNIKLIDFGASKQLNAQKGGATTSTAISYTNGYAPREQMEQNYDKFGPWTDIYALGATLYNLLTNKRPPLPTDIDDDESEDKHKALPFPDGIGSLKFLVLQMMKTNRMQRLQSIDAVIGKLSRKVEPKQTPNPAKAPQSSSAYDDEATIIAEPKTKKERKTEAPKPKPKESDSGYSQTPPKQETYTSSHIEDKRLLQKAAEQGYEDAQKALLYIEQQANQNSNNTNNLSGDESTIIDRGGHETTTVTSQPNSTSTTNSSDSQSGGSEKWYIIWVIFLTILCIWGGCTNRGVICAIGGVGLFVSGWVKTLFFDK